MSVGVGTRIGPYEILAPLGSGGMGEVYRARDAKLNRDVAIKVLPQLFSADPDRLARFQREAQVLASLNHQNIGHIYGLEDSSGIHALVLELVDGPTLADRIAEGPMPLDDAIPIARQIADALECAHEQGIIHRDLKPANIKLRPDGTVKVLDFGLAKALDPVAASSPDAMNSPTVTARGTQLGVIIGTAAYMAPEQARGRVVDRRADIWGFGVVLYEMLSGKRAFAGDDVSITLASVLKDDVDWKALPANVPGSVLRLLRRCLEKEPRRRLSAIADARLDLDDKWGHASEERSAQAATPPAAPSWRVVLPWAVATAAVTGGALWAPWRGPAATPAIRVIGHIGVEASLTVGVATAAVLSPDGNTIVFVAANDKDRPRLYVRRLSELQTIPLAGTEDAHGPFFSPVGNWIGFFAGGSLKKIPVTGGAAITLCAAPSGRGGSWSKDGTIVFQPVNTANALLQRVSEDGGTPVSVGSQAADEVTQRFPQVLPNGAVLYSGNRTTTGWDVGTVMVYPPGDRTPRQLLQGGFHARYVSTGHLLYVNQGTVFAVPFDLDRLSISGTAVPVIERVVSATNTGGAQFSVSENGTLIYLSGTTITRETPIYTMDATGASTVLRATAAEWYWPRFSPDGRRLAITIGVGDQSDIWIHEAKRDLTKFTFEKGIDGAPVWTPDGERIAFASARGTTALPNLYWQRSNGTGPVERLAESQTVQVPSSFHRSGKYLAYSERVDANNHDIWILPFEGDAKAGWKPGKPTAFLSTPANETAADFSPDGRWLAYVSNETGSPEVYVRPFPSGNGKWKVSNATGIFPRWSNKGGIFYAMPVPTSSAFAVMYAPYTSDGESFQSEVPRQWSPQAALSHSFEGAYDIHPDGKRIVFAKPLDLGPAVRDTTIFVFNFHDELRRAAAAKR